MKVLQIILLLTLSVTFSKCTDKEEDLDSIEPTEYNEDWSTGTHSNDVDPNYDVAFPQDKVLRIDIIIPAENWVIMQNDLQENIGSSGGGPGGGGPGGETSDGFDPVWVTADLEFDNLSWNNIGVRYKGNSSLRSVFQENEGKYSFKLDFDEFEDDYPETKNQRFYGFKQLNLNNNYEDKSEMHEKIAPEFFREFGLVAPQTSFCAVYVDNGTGPQYYGLYTLVEEVDNTVIETQYTMSDGNLYKPEGNGATFAQGTFNTTDMYKKTNEETGDYSDVEALYNALHNTTRNTDTEVWKTSLESVFDVNIFLKWLAVNTTIQNWDTYGRMNHNFYLYNNPESNKIEWIPWDNNEAFYDGKQGGALQIDLSDVGTDWPIINYILAIPEYETIYKDYLNDFISTVFYSDKMLTTYNRYYELINQYVIEEEPGYTFTSSSDFESEVNFLNQHVVSRKEVVESYIK